jgi:hypothetical protein
MPQALVQLIDRRSFRFNEDIACEHGQLAPKASGTKMVTQAVCAYPGDFDIHKRSVLYSMHGFTLEQAILIFCHNEQIMELILEVYPDAIIVPVKSEVCAVCQASTMVCSLNARSGPFQSWANRSN